MRAAGALAAAAGPSSLPHRPRRPAAPAAPLAAPHRAGGSRLMSAALCGAPAAALRRVCRGAPTRRGAALLPLAAAAPRVSDVTDMTADGSVRRRASVVSPPRLWRAS
jgi:hypothetical protein